MAQPFNILVVDDEDALRNVLSSELQGEGYSVVSAADGDEAISILEQKSFHLVLLDIKMPRMDGMEVLSKLREQSAIPVIFLTSKDDEVDEVIGLRMGADDYVGKPFSNKVLLAKVKALLRRVEGQGEPGDVTENSGVKIDRVRHRVTLKDEPLDLTPTEFRLLECLVRQPGRGEAVLAVAFLGGPDDRGGTGLVLLRGGDRGPAMWNTQSDHDGPTFDDFDPRWGTVGALAAVPAAPPDP